MKWAPSFVLGPSLLVTRDFSAAGFDFSGGPRHFTDYDPNSIVDSTAASIFSLGVLALPKGAVLGNEHGLDLSVRLYFPRGGRDASSITLKPVARVLQANHALSLPSVLGTVLPAVGLAKFGEPDTTRPSAYSSRWFFLARWSFAPRLVLVEDPVLLSLELEPAAEIYVPLAGGPALAAFSGCVNLGFGVMRR
jgi:hypothetical protein